MDVREQETQPQRPSIKRPWDEGMILSEQTSAWQGATLPPIDGVPYRRTSLIPEPEPRGNSYNLPRADRRDSVSGRESYEGNRYFSLSRENLDLNTKLLQAPPASAAVNNPHDRSDGSPSFPPKFRVGGREQLTREAPQDTANLCQRCRRLTTQHPGLDVYDSSEDCRRDPELALVAEKAAAALSQLAETLSLGISSEHRGIIRAPDRSEVSSPTYPPIAQFGLKHTLDWFLGRIHHINSLADKYVRHAPSEQRQIQERNFVEYGSRAQDDLGDIMKRRRIDDDGLDDAYRSRADEPASDARSQSRRKSATTSNVIDEEPPSLTSQQGYQPPHSIDGPSRRPSIMNPPPAPHRQLPSPPGRSLPSPTSLNFPSPSAGSFGSTSQPGLNLPPPSSLHQPSPLSGFLPHIGLPPSSDALQTYTASLQHEVSVQKIAFSSLQGEHDKLLAAFSRSQTRASALEKKHAVSDSEIISLSEEKMRLQAQLVDLERDVEELARSRDESRQSAVLEGAQYVEIVKKASRLEEMAAEERKSWNKLKAEMEGQIQALSARSNLEDESVEPDTAAATPRPSAHIPIAVPAGTQTDLKTEPEGISQSPLDSTELPQESSSELKEEIQRLRRRCMEVEKALRTVRDQSRNMEGMLQLLGSAGKSILEQANQALEKEPDD